MNLEEFAGLNRSWGHSISLIGTRYFVRRSHRLYHFPAETITRVDRELVRNMRWKALATSVLMDIPRKDMYEFILSTRSYYLDGFDKKTRSGIRKSLKNCTFRRPELEELFTDGLRINRATLARQAKTEEILSDRNKWQHYMTSVYHHEAFRILGAFYQGRMVGYLIIYPLEGKFNILKAYIDREDSAITHPMAGLLYTMINSLISEFGQVTVSYGMHEFRGHSTLNSFKKHMLFQPVPSTRGYILHPFLAPLLGMAICFLVRILKRHRFKRSWSRKLLRTYQGYRHLRSEVRRWEGS